MCTVAEVCGCGRIQRKHVVFGASRLFKGSVHGAKLDCTFSFFLSNGALLLDELDR